MAIDVVRGELPIRGFSAVAVDQDRIGRIAIFLFFAGVVLSTTLVLNVFDLTVSADRVVLLVFFVPMLVAIGQSNTLRLQAFDYLFFAALAWLAISLSVNNGIERGVKYGGALAVEAIGAYLLARVYVRSFAQFTFAVHVYVLFVVIAGIIALPEALFGVKLIAGLGPQIGTLEMGRLGLHRATSGFDHPILYGAFCATSLGLVWYLYLDRPVRWVMAAVIVGAAFLALSSAALLACLLVAVFVLCERYTRTIPNRVAIMLSIGAVGYVIVAAFTNRTPIEVLLPFISLDPWTALYRVYIWQYALMNIGDNPIFGLGLNEWVRPVWMPVSVDSLWLTLMLLGGIPVLVLLAGGMILLMRRVHERPAGAESRRRWLARFGWTVAVIALCFQAFTVHYWGAMHAVFYFVLGLGAWVTDSGAELARSTTEPESQGAPLIGQQALVSRSAPGLITRGGG